MFLMYKRIKISIYLFVYFYKFFVLQSYLKEQKLQGRYKKIMILR